MLHNVFSWNELITQAKKLFPEVNLNRLILAEDDLGLLVREVARAHDLTLAEASEMVTLRLPSYEPYPERLSA